MTFTNQQRHSIFIFVCQFCCRNERAGVPCEVLQVLQASVQIPQSGTVRSLNVHVSGALFVWEYTRQLLTRSLNMGEGVGSGGGRCGNKR